MFNNNYKIIELYILSLLGGVLAMRLVILVFIVIVSVLWGDAASLLHVTNGGRKRLNALRSVCFGTECVYRCLSLKIVVNKRLKI